MNRRGPWSPILATICAVGVCAVPVWVVYRALSPEERPNVADLMAVAIAALTVGGQVVAWLWRRLGRRRSADPEAVERAKRELAERVTVQWSGAVEHRGGPLVARPARPDPGPLGRHRRPHAHGPPGQPRRDAAAGARGRPGLPVPPRRPARPPRPGVRARVPRGAVAASHARRRDRSHRWRRVRSVAVRYVVGVANRSRRNVAGAAGRDAVPAGARRNRCRRLPAKAC